MTSEARNMPNLPILNSGTKQETAAGNYFVSNYPPFSFWSSSENHHVDRVLSSTAAAGADLGLYVHIPFCRKRCDFCYFRVYTDKNADEIQRYMDAVIAEVERYAAQPYLQNRRPRFIYFGGGTPSYLSHTQMAYFFEGLQRALPWDGAEEVAFECEPGTLGEIKIKTLHELGVTRLSLGIENFDPDILELNNRAHRAKEIYRAYDYAREIGFEQINIDLIAGMVGETDENWQTCIEKTLELAADSVTIYQMEVPFNTTIYKRMRDGNQQIAPVADWETKRRWVHEAFQALEERGYTVGSAYTAVKNDSTTFLYRDALWTGADMLGVGVSSFSHLGGVHFQNEPNFDPYVSAVQSGDFPMYRAHLMDKEEKLIREFILQMKLGQIGTAYFTERFGVEVIARFGDALAKHRDAGYLTFDDEQITLTRSGLLQADGLLPAFFLDCHQQA